MPYSDITENILKQMRTAGEPKTTTTTGDIKSQTTPADPGFGGAQMGALLGMLLSKLINTNNSSIVNTPTGQSRDFSNIPLPSYNEPAPNYYPSSQIQGITAPAVQSMSAADQLPAGMYEALAAKTPQELMAILEYAKKMQAQEGLGMGLA